jgi:hypothetical protein
MTQPVIGSQRVRHLDGIEGYHSANAPRMGAAGAAPVATEPHNGRRRSPSSLLYMPIAWNPEST